jgi:hypothetical protein
MTSLEQRSYILIRVGFQSFHCQTSWATRLSPVTRAVYHSKERAIVDGFNQMAVA